MTENTETAILPFKVLDLAKIISDKKRLSLYDSLFYLYNSELYYALLDPKQKMWYNSGYELYELLEVEKSVQKQKQIAPNAAQFLLFNIEQYRMAKRMTPASVLELFVNTGADKFLINNFEVLHSQSAEYILHELDTFIKKRR